MITEQFCYGIREFFWEDFFESENNNKYLSSREGLEIIPELGNTIFDHVIIFRNMQCARVWTVERKNLHVWT